MEYLIPHHWFSEAHYLLLILYAVGGLYFLSLGAEWLVEGASGLAFRFGMPEVIVGATIVSLGTTAPECTVSVLAAFNGNPGLALGNAVGSVIADTALIFGIGCLIASLPADRYVLSRQGWVQFGSAVLLAVLCYTSFFLHGENAQVGRAMGVGLLFLLCIYMYLSVIWSKRHPEEQAIRVSETIAEHAVPGEQVHVADEHVTTKPSWMLGGMILVGLTIVIFSGHFAIESVSELAGRVGIPDVVIASTLVAFGTSLPELMVGITAIRKGHAELLVGNVLGADILNILFVIGAAATAAPLPIIDNSLEAKVPNLFLYLHLPAMLIILGFFRLCIFSATKHGNFKRWMGIPLLVMYLIYTVSQLVISL